MEFSLERLVFHNSTPSERKKNEHHKGIKLDDELRSDPAGNHRRQRRQHGIGVLRGWLRRHAEPADYRARKQHRDHHGHHRVRLAGDQLCFVHRQSVKKPADGLLGDLPDGIAAVQRLSRALVDEPPHLRRHRDRRWSGRGRIPREGQAGEDLAGTRRSRRGHDGCWSKW